MITGISTQDFKFPAASNNFFVSFLNNFYPLFFYSYSYNIFVGFYRYLYIALTFAYFGKGLSEHMIEMLHWKLANCWMYNRRRKVDIIPHKIWSKFFLNENVEEDVFHIFLYVSNLNIRYLRVSKSQIKILSVKDFTSN